MTTTTAPTQIAKLRAENERLRNILAARGAAETTRRTGLEEPEICYDTECGSRCEHGGICSEKPGHGGLHNASGYCTWMS